MEPEDQTCLVVDWGLEAYGRILALQRELVAARKAGRVPDVLLLGEHTPVITLGRNAHRENLLLPEDELARRGLEVHETDRGGDVTYHGPGQLVGYPILDLANLRRDVVWYVRSLEEVLIRAALSFGLKAERRSAPKEKQQLYTGVWVGEEKLAATGVHLSRWVTSHGFAFNVTTDLSHFDFIVPCGLRDKGVTSLGKLLPNRSAQRLLPLGPTLNVPSLPAPAGGKHVHPVAGATLRLRSGQAGLGEEVLTPSGRSRWAERDSGELMARLKTEVVRAFGEVFAREMRATDLDSLEATLAPQQAAAS